MGGAFREGGGDLRALFRQCLRMSFAGLLGLGTTVEDHFHRAGQSQERRLPRDSTGPAQGARRAPSLSFFGILFSDLDIPVGFACGSGSSR